MRIVFSLTFKKNICRNSTCYLANGLETGSRTVQAQRNVGLRSPILKNSLTRAV